MEVSNSIFIFNYFKNVFYVQLIQDTARYLMQIETKNKKDRCHYPQYTYLRTDDKSQNSTLRELREK